MLDHGRDFYAPTTLVEDDRTQLWGWSWESRTERESVAAGWAGRLTHPREIGVHPDGTLRLAPARELTVLRGEELASGAELPAAYEIELDVRVAQPDSEVVLSLGDAVSFRVNPTRGTFVLDRTGSPATAPPPLSRTAEAIATVPGGTRSHVRVLVDGRGAGAGMGAGRGEWGLRRGGEEGGGEGGEG